MPASTQTLSSRFTGLFLNRVDARIYDCVRIVFAVVSLINLMGLWPDRASLFTEAGMIDQDIVRQYSIGTYVSVFQFCSSMSAVGTYMLFSGAAMILLLLGVVPRAAAFAVFVWHVSYATRAPIALAGWDHVLRSLSFLVLVSPMPVCWSLHFGRVGKKAAEALLVTCYGLTLMRMQVVVIYWQTVLARFENSFWMNGEFLSYFLLSHNARWPGLWVADYGPWLKVATWLVLAVEFVIPLLLMSRRWHRLGFLAGFLLHAGICLTSRNLGMFFLAMMALYTSFLRKEDIEWLTQRFRVGSQARRR